jgi:hypothetical protein
MGRKRLGRLPRSCRRGGMGAASSTPLLGQEESGRARRRGRARMLEERSRARGGGSGTL